MRHSDRLTVSARAITKLALAALDPNSSRCARPVKNRIRPPPFGSTDHSKRSHYFLRSVFGVERYGRVACEQSSETYGVERYGRSLSSDASGIPDPP